MYVEDIQERLPYPEFMPNARYGPDIRFFAMMKLFRIG